MLAVPGVAQGFGLFTGHPYECSPKRGCSGDRVGSDATWVFPSASDGGGTLPEKLLRAHAMLQDASAGQAKIWPSEVGWALEQTATPASTMALAHAAAISQALVLLRSLSASSEHNNDGGSDGNDDYGGGGGVFGRFYLFTGLETGYENGDYNFGLWRNNNTVILADFRFNADVGAYPLPAAAAYGTAAAFLEIPTIAVGSVQTAGNLTLALFQRGVGSNTQSMQSGAWTVVVVWTSVAEHEFGTFDERCFRIACQQGPEPGSEHGSQQGSQQGPSSLAISAAWNGLGNSIPIGSKVVQFDMSPLPTFLVVNASADASAVDDLVKLLGACGRGDAECWC